MTALPVMTSEIQNARLAKCSQKASQGHLSPEWPYSANTVNKGTYPEGNDSKSSTHVGRLVVALVCVLEGVGHVVLPGALVDIKHANVHRDGHSSPELR